SFGVLASLIFLGFLGNQMFTRLRVNDTLLLIAIGFLLGPVLDIVPVAPVARASGLVGALALLLILFDGGLALRFRDIAHGAGPALTLALLGFVATVALVATTMVYLDGSSWMVGLLYGSIVGGTSSLVVIPTLANLRADPKTSAILALESALTDVFVVVTVFTLVGIQAAREGAVDTTLDASGIASSIVILFLVSLGIGAVAGLGWLLALPRVIHKNFGYMLTLGVALATYAVAEWVLRGAQSGGGPLAVLAFGIILGNGTSMGAYFRRFVTDDQGAGVKRFQGELAFLVRTFFFIVLGILVDPRALTDPFVLAVGVAVFAALAVGRYVGTVPAMGTFRLQGEAKLVWWMMPRGLAAAVMAAVPMQQGLQGTERFVALTFIIIVLTNVATTIGGFMVKPGSAPTAIPAKYTPAAYAPATEGFVVFEDVKREPPKVRKNLPHHEPRIDVVGEGLPPGAPRGPAKPPKPPR
ncbi:MAG TPA: cation:proton antiporter, partial [Candidatus Thermoplasmatota archaeon]|nr:cation:proton antiporter [Candidatus Thermoplasmatota archaeon]